MLRRSLPPDRDGEHGHTTVSTVIHSMVEQCRAGHYPPRVARLSSGWVVMGERQVLPGYCLLLPDPVVPHLNALHGDARAEFLADMALVGDALLTVTGALRVNYAIFGNVEPALHAHIFPRHADEPEAIRTLQPWALDWQSAPGFNALQHDALKHLLAEELQRRRAPRSGAA
jgi:diadenosine tetraphosphate (Ap4A) HIT family hydrolase